MNFLNATSSPLLLNDSTAMGSCLSQRSAAGWSVLILIAAVVGMVEVLAYSGLLFDMGELMPALRNTIALEGLASMGLAALLLSDLLIYRHYLLFLSFFKALRSAFLRTLRTLYPPAPAAYTAPRHAHGCRAPPSFS